MKLNKTVPKSYTISLSLPSSKSVHMHLYLMLISGCNITSAVWCSPEASPEDKSETAAERILSDRDTCCISNPV